MKNQSISGLVLAAGFSSRMKQFKPLMKINGKSFIQTVIEKSAAVCDKIIVVTGFNSELLKNHISAFSNDLLSKIKIVNNPQLKGGMFSSLQEGLKYCLNTDWVLYHFVDQPAVPSKFYIELLAQIDDKHDWIQPSYKGRNGHPLLFNKKLINQILKSPETSNLREFKNNFSNQKLWECQYKEIIMDFDTPQNFEEYISNI